MQKKITNQSVIVSRKSVDSKEPYDIVYSNITFLNALKAENFTHNELSQNALCSYYVDYYLAQVNNGGFSQFVYNSSWDENTIQYVLKGLQSMGATEYFKLFSQSISILDQIGPDRLYKFLDSEYFGENKERDILNEFSDKFYDLKEREDLIKLNADWLKNLPNLVVMEIDEMKIEVKRRAPDFPTETRAAEALANEPRFKKLIRALCSATGHKLLLATVGNPSHKHKDQQILARHFITDKGFHYMVDADGKAMMFNGISNEQIVEIKASDEYGAQ